MTTEAQLSPIKKMYNAGFGTGHGLDLRPIQVAIEGDRGDEPTIHNILRQVTRMGLVAGAFEPIPMTMCGIRLEDTVNPPYGIREDASPYDGGITTCSRCAILAAWQIVSVAGL